MPLPNPFRRLKAETSTVDELSAELGKLDRIRLDAQNQLHDLGAKRPGLLVDGTDAQLAKLDADMATARRALAQAEARIEAITPEWQEADRRETAAKLDRQRRDAYAAALKARADGARLLVEYDKGAAALAASLRRLAEIEGQIAEVNLDLPPDLAPIGSAEPNNGRADVPDRWPEIEVWADANGAHHGHAAPGASPPFHGARRVVTRGFAPTPGAPGFPHRPLGSRVGLPAVDPNAPPHWSGAPTMAVPRHPGLLGGLMPFRGARA